MTNQFLVVVTNKIKNYHIKQLAVALPSIKCSPMVIINTPTMVLIVQAPPSINKNSSMHIMYMY